MVGCGRTFLLSHDEGEGCSGEYIHTYFARYKAICGKTHMPVLIQHRNTIQSHPIKYNTLQSVHNLL